MENTPAESMKNSGPKWIHSGIFGALKLTNNSNTLMYIWGSFEDLKMLRNEMVLDKNWKLQTKII